MTRRMTCLPRRRHSSPRAVSLSRQPLSRKPVSNFANPTRPFPKNTALVRSFHSYEHPTPDEAFSSPEEAILNAAYAHVPACGFTTVALARGARDAGYRDISVSVLPDGVFGLVRWHLVTRRKVLAGLVTDSSIFDGLRPEQVRLLGVGDKVERLLWARLMGNIGILHKWQEALAVMAQPSYAPESLAELAKLVDEIWFLAGDVSVDSSWYTKRASLSAIYVATELFMTNDRSVDFVDTQNFLRRRLEEANDFGGAVRAAGQWLSFTGSASLNILRSRGLPI